MLGDIARVMANYEHAGAVMRAFRKQAKLSQKALAAKTQLVDEKGIGISETALSLIEHGKRFLSPKYLKLIHAAEVFTSAQMQALCRHAIADMVRENFADVPFGERVYVSDYSRNTVFGRDSDTQCASCWRCIS